MWRRNVRTSSFRTRQSCKAVALGLLVGFTACNSNNSYAPPPDRAPAQIDSISLQPQDWNIYYSADVPPHPVADPAGMWAIQMPKWSQTQDAHLNYVQTPLQQVMVGQTVTLTFMIENQAAYYYVLDSGDRLPATVHIFFWQKDDGLMNADGRWWAHGGYNLGSADNQIITLTVPFTSDHWTNVYGYTDPERFAAALKNIGWIGMTFGGQFFWGHGIAIGGTSAKFVLINVQLN